MVAGGVTLTCTGLCSRLWARSAMFSGMVAEKNSDWRWRATWK